MSLKIKNLVLKSLDESTEVMTWIDGWIYDGDSQAAPRLAPNKANDKYLEQYYLDPAFKQEEGG